MSSLNTTVLVHIYNEEYLLPFWLEHHKYIFDDIVIIDYKSTDNSIEICKRICPACKIITTRNAWFDAIEVDAEIMDIENNIEGIKMVLNVTEFLFCEKPIKEFFANIKTTCASYAVAAITPYSKTAYNIKNKKELITNLLNDDVVFHYDRCGTRQIHNFPNGAYSLGRHSSYNKHEQTFFLHIVWMGFYPMNDKNLQRKLQIQKNIPQSDKDRGHGYQHLFSADKILTINYESSNTGKSLKDINYLLYNLIHCQYIKKLEYSCP